MPQENCNKAIMLVSNIDKFRTISRCVTVHKHECSLYTVPQFEFTVQYNKREREKNRLN